VLDHTRHRLCTPSSAFICVCFVRFYGSIRHCSPHRYGLRAEHGSYLYHMVDVVRSVFSTGLATAALFP
jgi:hypothetical protein